MKKYSILSILIALVFTSTLATAQTAGSLDTSFNSTGFYTQDFGNQDNLNDVAIQPNQKIVTTGVSLSSGFIGTLKALRFNTDGTPDITFATNGVFTYTSQNEAYGVACSVTGEGKIIIAGLVSGPNYIFDMLLMRLDSNGVIDPTFGTNGMTISSFTPQDDFVQDMTLQSDGKILISGTIMDSVTFFNQPAIVRYTEDGIIDSTFGVNGVVVFPALDIDNELTSIAVQNNGKIIGAGHYSKVFTGAMDFDVLVVCVDSNGIPDPTFGVNGVVKTPINGGIDDSFGMTVDADQNIFVGGFTVLPFSGTFDMVCLKYDSLGALVTNFGTGGIVTFNNSDEEGAYDIVLQSDNKIVLGGTSGLSFLGPRPMALWRYLPNGTLDNSFGVNGFDTIAIGPGAQDINSIALQADGKIVAAGKASNGTNNDIAVLRVLNDLTVSVSEITTNSDLSVYPNPIAPGDVLTIQGDFENASSGLVTIVDITGKLIGTYDNLKFQNSTLQIVLTETLKSGIYIVSVTNEKTKVVGKLVVQ